MLSVLRQTVVERCETLELAARRARRSAAAPRCGKRSDASALAVTIARIPAVMRTSTRHGRAPGSARAAAARCAGRRPARDFGTARASRRAAAVRRTGPTRPPTRAPHGRSRSLAGARPGAPGDKRRPARLCATPRQPGEVAQVTLAGALELPARHEQLVGVLAHGLEQPVARPPPRGLAGARPPTCRRAGRTRRP